MTPSLENLADLSIAVVSTETAHGKASAALAAAQAARDAVASRLSAAQERLRAIGARRAGGDLREDDAQEAGLLHADVAGLQDLLARRDAEVEAAQAPVSAATAELSTARLQLQRAEVKATEQALAGRAEQAAAVLLEALQQMRALRDANGGGLLPFKVSDALWSELVPIRHLRPW
jgi:hypothetical protein